MWEAAPSSRRERALSRFWWWRVVVEPALTEEVEAAQEELLRTPSRLRLAPTTPWSSEPVGQQQSTQLVMALLEQIHSLAEIQPLAVRVGIAAMPW
jgi:hypothetical protein